MPKPFGSKKSRDAARSQDTSLIFGLHPVEAALRNERRIVRCAYFTPNAAARFETLLAARNVDLITSPPSEIDLLFRGVTVHQGAVLEVERLGQPALDEFLTGRQGGQPSTVAMLDQVTDPHNVGAVLRSAAAFGVDAVIVQTRHSPPLDGTLAKAASGALEYVPVIEAVNLARSLEALKEAGYECAGFDSAAPLDFGPEAAGAPRTALVFGAEDKGLRRLVREGCDGLYTLGAAGPILSLNISSAAAIAFYIRSTSTRPR